MIRNDNQIHNAEESFQISILFDTEYDIDETAKLENKPLTMKAALDDKSDELNADVRSVELW